MTTSLIIESKTQQQINIIQSNCCFLLRADIILGSHIASKPFTLNRELNIQLKAIVNRISPSSLDYTSKSSTIEDFDGLKKTLELTENNIECYDDTYYFSRKHTNLSWKFESRSRLPITTLTLGHPGMRRRVSRVLNMAFPIIESDKIAIGIESNGLVSACYQSVFEEEAQDRLIQKRIKDRESTILNRSRFEASISKNSQAEYDFENHSSQEDQSIMNIDQSLVSSDDLSDDENTTFARLRIPKLLKKKRTKRLNTRSSGHDTSSQSNKLCGSKETSIHSKTILDDNQIMVSPSCDDKTLLDETVIAGLETNTSLVSFNSNNSPTIPRTMERLNLSSQSDIGPDIPQSTQKPESIIKSIEPDTSGATPKKEKKKAKKKLKRKSLGF